MGMLFVGVLYVLGQGWVGGSSQYFLFSSAAHFKGARLSWALSAAPLAGRVGCVAARPAR
jgi:hypothetical protein